MATRSCCASGHVDGKGKSLPATGGGAGGRTHAAGKDGGWYGKGWRLTEGGEWTQETWSGAGEEWSDGGQHAWPMGASPASPRSATRSRSQRRKKVSGDTGSEIPMDTAHGANASRRVTGSWFARRSAIISDGSNWSCQLCGQVHSFEWWYLDCRRWPLCAHCVVALLAPCAEFELEIHWSLFLRPAQLEQYGTLARDFVVDYVAASSFGERLCGWKSARSMLYDFVAIFARNAFLEKQGDIISTSYKLVPSLGVLEPWLESYINLVPRSHRSGFVAVRDVYRPAEAVEKTVLVAFANARVGDCCFAKGFVQEEQMVLQSTDMAVRLRQSKPCLKHLEVLLLQSVYFDAWWSREAAAEKEELRRDAIEVSPSCAVNVLFANAPNMKHKTDYSLPDLRELATKICSVFAVAEAVDAPCIFSGLLGGGAFRNNRALILLLHLLLQPRDTKRILKFHLPVMRSYSSMSCAELELSLVRHADKLLSELQRLGVRTLGEALDALFGMSLRLSHCDADLVCE